MRLRDRIAAAALWAFEGPDYRSWLIHINVAQWVSLSPFGWRAAAFFYLAKEVEAFAYALAVAQWDGLPPLSWRLEDRIPDALLPTGMAVLMGWLLGWN